MTPAASLRRDLGRCLASARKAAGYTQHQLALATGYSRSTVSNAEIGHPDVARIFWARCDKVLKSGRSYELAFEKIRAAERGHGRPAAEQPPPPRPVPAGAAAGRRLVPRRRRRRGAGRATRTWAGPRRAGTTRWNSSPARSWTRWSYPGRPGCWRRRCGCTRAAARTTPGDCPPCPTRPGRWPSSPPGTAAFFLAAAGGCPWPGPVAGQPGPGPGTGREARPGERPGARLGDGPGGQPSGQPGPPTGRRRPRVIRWHSGGSRIPAPPSRLSGGGQAAWAHLPSHPVQLASPAALLGLLATASAGVSDGPAGLTLPGGVRVLPPPAPDDSAA